MGRCAYVISAVQEQWYEPGQECEFDWGEVKLRMEATIITTNLPFTRWEEVLKDKVLCSALVDRLCHKSY